MSFDDYKVTIYFTNHFNRPDQLSFDVMAYSKEEAEDLAFTEFSRVVGVHLGYLEYQTEIIE